MTLLALAIGALSLAAVSAPPPAAFSNMIRGGRLRRREGSRASLHEAEGTRLSLSGPARNEHGVSKAHHGGRYTITTLAAAPSTAAAITPGPTASPIRAPATAAPTRPVLNTLSDCGPQHVDCIGRLDSGYDALEASIQCLTSNTAARCNEMPCAIVA